MTPRIASKIAQRQVTNQNENRKLQLMTTLSLSVFAGWNSKSEVIYAKSYLLAEYNRTNLTDHLYHTVLCLHTHSIIIIIFNFYNVLFRKGP